MIDKTMPVEGKFMLQPLRFKADALSPVISRQTIEIHHGKHLLTYVNNINTAIEDTQWQGRALEDILCSAAEGGLLNNVGQAVNHNLYFEQFTAPGSGGSPAGKLAEVIDRQYGSLADMQAQFERIGTTLFGSGWVWLTADDSGRLDINQYHNADNPLRHGLMPLLTMDVWEHAYYLDYQNRRADHLKALWSAIDWSVVARRLQRP